jgi:hypothetical protein
MKRGRTGIVAVMIVSLLIAAILRTEAAAWQYNESGQTEHGTHGIGNLNSFALALVLGGLRGPLVMFLWSSSENQKNDRDLADFDTKVEWIRLLQPEFDTVHLFQIWNKAYNISVLMASPADKYVVVMQALDYANSVLIDKPGDINILSAIENVYSNKLGAHIAHPEERFYNRQLREESMTDAARKIAYPEEKGFSRLWKETLSLDDDNRILPAQLAPSRPKPPGVQGEWNDGSRLQYLAKFEPFPLGISPSALAYNYAKQSQVAQSVEGQVPQQLGPMVIDSRPAIELEGWSLEESTLARNAEARAFNIEVVDTATEANDAALAGISPTAQPSDPHQLAVAIDEYQRSIRVAEEAIAEYNRHLKNPIYATRITTYLSHFEDLNADIALSIADRDYLQVRTAAGPEAARFRLEAAAQYRTAVSLLERIILRYYMEDEIVAVTFPPNTTRQSIRDFSDQQVWQIFNRAMSFVAKMQYSQFSDDRSGYVQGISRATTRFKLLQPGG